LKKIFTILFISVINYSLICAQDEQEWDYNDGIIRLIDTSKTWNVLVQQQYYRTKCYKFEGDTIVQNKKYSKLYYSYSENFDKEKSVYCCGIRDDGGEMYIRYPFEIEYLLYDFNVKLCDTLNMGMVNRAAPLLVQVEYVDTVEMLGKTRKIIHLIPLDRSSSVPQTWIQGIGSTLGLVETAHAQYFMYNTALLCYKEKDSLIWQNENWACYFSTAPEDRSLILKGNKKIIEAKDIQFSDDFPPQSFTLKVFTARGLYLETVKISRKRKVNLKKLESGDYIVQLINNKGRIVATTNVKL